MNASGISGVAKLEPAGELKTRITVLEVHGGDITGARVMPEPCSHDLDDKFPITPPTGVVQVDFEQFRRWDDAGPLAVVFMRRGRYVACGES
jgi:hypothetical protein